MIDPFRRRVAAQEKAQDSEGLHARGARHGASSASGRTPGEIPPDGLSMPRDHGPCDACGNVDLLAPGSTLCPWCEDVSRAAALAAARARAARGAK